MVKVSNSLSKMMDYYSNFPAPDLQVAREEVKQEVNHLYKTNKNDYFHRISDEEINSIIQQAFIQSNHLNVEHTSIVKFSYTGWYHFGKPDIITLTTNKIDDILLKKKQNQRLLRGIFKTTYLLIKANKDSIERIYHPDSIYVKNILNEQFHSKR